MLIDDFCDLSHLIKTEAQTYLESRGIRVLPKLGVRISHLEMEPETGKYYTAIIAAMTDDRMKIAYLHKTFLNNGEKVKGINAKKIFTNDGLAKVECSECGAQNNSSCSVKLFDCGDTLGISEGFETALSAHQIYGTPTWMTANTAFMKSFIAPPHVKHLIIYADNDKSGAGLEAAFICGHKNIKRKGNLKRVTIRVPRDVEDFNDMLTNQSDVQDWILLK